MCFFCQEAIAPSNKCKWDYVNPFTALMTQVLLNVGKLYRLAHFVPNCGKSAIGNNQNTAWININDSNRPVPNTGKMKTFWRMKKSFFTTFRSLQCLKMTHKFVGRFRSLEMAENRSLLWPPSLEHLTIIKVNMTLSHQILQYLVRIISSISSLFNRKVGNQHISSSNTLLFHRTRVILLVPIPLYFHVLSWSIA